MLSSVHFILLFATLLWPSAAATLQCGSEDPPAELMAAHRVLSEQGSTGNIKRQALPVIDLYVHVVDHSRQTIAVTDELVSEQV